MFKCSEYEPDRHARDELEHAQKEIRRLFELYRAASRREATAEREAGVEAPDPVRQQEPALASH